MGPENFAENFTTSLNKLLPIEADANTNASAVEKLQETFWELLLKTT